MIVSSRTAGRRITPGLLALLASACIDGPSASVLSPTVDYATVRDSAGPRPLQALSTLDGGIVLPERAMVRVTLLERNAAWWHALSIIAPESRLLAGPGYLFPGGHPFDLGPYDPGEVVFRLDAYDPRSPHDFFGSAAAKVSGSFPNWVIGWEDGSDGDFDDIIMGVLAIPEGDACAMFDDDDVSDSLLLDPAVQRILKELAALSNFDEPFANRLERGGYIVEQLDGTIEFVEHRYLTPAGTPGGQPELCVIPFDPGYQREIQHGGGTILGQIHTHPTQGGSEPNPGTCNQWIPKGPGTFDVQPLQGSSLKFSPGPSGRDTDDWERGLAPWPGYMMSPDRVYRWERKGPFQTGLDKQDNFKLQKGANACIAG